MSIPYYYVFSIDVLELDPRKYICTIHCSSIDGKAKSGVYYIGSAHLDLLDVKPRCQGDLFYVVVKDPILTLETVILCLMSSLGP